MRSSKRAGRRNRCHPEEGMWTWMGMGHKGRGLRMGGRLQGETGEGNGGGDKHTAMDGCTAAAASTR